MFRFPFAEVRVVPGVQGGLDWLQGVETCLVSVAGREDCFTVWKNTAALEDGYVTGLEPATNFPNLKTFERSQNRVPVLPPGGSWETTWSIEVQDSAAGVSGVLKEIVSLQTQAKAVVHRTPQARFSAAAGG